MKFVLDREEWNRLVKDFPNWDIYYLYEYVHSLEMHGDGTPLLLYWKNSQMELCYVALGYDIPFPALCCQFFYKLLQGLLGYFSFVQRAAVSIGGCHIKEPAAFKAPIESLEGSNILQHCYVTRICKKERTPL